MFEWVAVGPTDPKNIGQPGCGGCHPGGGGLEFDRDGKRYDQRLKEDPSLAQSLDGDYYKSKWDKSGVVEADCLICHLPGYNFPERNKQLKMWNFKWASTAASGIGQVVGLVKEGQEPRVFYNRRLFNEDGKIVLDLAYPPPSENCNFCHGISDAKKRGFSWNDRRNFDVHNSRGMSCADCHPAIEDPKLKITRIQHQFAKGDENVSSVRDDLDNTIMTCKDCHYQGYMGAPRPAHLSVRPNHLEKLACEVCHIPQLHIAGGEGFDVTTGAMVNYPTMNLHDPAKSPKRIGDYFSWHPRFAHLKRGQLAPVNVLLGVFYTNLDKDGIHYPLFGRENKKAYEKAKDQLKPADPMKPEIHTPEQIKIILTALSETLQGSKRFQQIKPYYHKGGMSYHLDDKGEVVAAVDHTWAAHMEGFNINHNVAPTGLALGAGGCGDCHSTEAHMFKGQIVTSLFGPTGKPDTISSGRLFGCQPWAFYLNQFHQLYLTPYVSLLMLVLVFGLVLHYTGQGPKVADFYGAPTEITWFPLSERWTHLFRMGSFLILAFTGYIFFFNNITLLQMSFGTPQMAVIIHWVVGLIFLAASVISFGIWGKYARFEPYDKEWLAKHGGYLGGKEVEVPAGRMNAGQKIFFWLTTILTVIMGVTGVALIFKTDLPLTLSCLMSTIHGFFAVIFVAAIIAHAYLGTIANPGTWRILVDGKVSRNWAKKHHSVWYKEYVKEEEDKNPEA
ncbi:MAG: formate dehydrogenase subunit gamma [Deltaproteobacteria bacterium]|nr:formate dehydrogenase subunit gamma [Deltaproteobacteria bacterium]